MPLSSEELQHAMKLAALRFDSSQEAKICVWVDQVLEWFHELDELDPMIKELSPQLSQPIIPPIDAAPCQTLSQDEAIKNAPKTEQGFIKTSRIS